MCSICRLDQQDQRKHQTFSTEKAKLRYCHSLMPWIGLSAHLGHLVQARGACKTPKRLKDILSLLEKMVWMHGKCGYKPLRDKACPSKVIQKIIRCRNDNHCLFADQTKSRQTSGQCGYHCCEFSLIYSSHVSYLLLEPGTNV